MSYRIAGGIVVSVIGLFAGCGARVYDPSAPISVSFSPDTPDWMRLDVRVGVKYWQCVNVNIGFQEDGAQGDGLLIVAKPLYSETNSAKYNPDDGSISIDPDILALSPDVRIPLTVHEIGHALGLHHVDGEQLMRHHVPELRSLTDGDVRQFNFVWATEYAGPCPPVF